MKLTPEESQYLSFHSDIIKLMPNAMISHQMNYSTLSIKGTFKSYDIFISIRRFKDIFEAPQFNLNITSYPLNHSLLDDCIDTIDYDCLSKDIIKLITEALEIVTAKEALQ